MPGQHSASVLFPYHKEKSKLCKDKQPQERIKTVVFFVPLLPYASPTKQNVLALIVVAKLLLFFGIKFICGGLGYQ